MFDLSPVYTSNVLSKNIKVWNTQENATVNEFYRVCKRFIFKNVHPNDSYFFYTLENVSYNFSQYTSIDESNIIVRTVLYKNASKIMRQIYTHEYNPSSVCFFIFLMANIKYTDEFDTSSKSTLVTKSILEYLEDYKFTWVQMHDQVYILDGEQHDPLYNLREFLIGICNVLSKWNDDNDKKNDHWNDLVSVFKFAGIRVDEPFFMNYKERVYKIVNNFNIDNYTVEDLFIERSNFNNQEYLGLINLFTQPVARMMSCNKNYMRFLNTFISYMNAKFPGVTLTEISDSMYHSKDTSEVDEIVDFIHDILISYDPKDCTIIKSDIYTLKEFGKFKLSEIHKIINIAGSGHCYTYSYLAQMLIVYKGPSKLDLDPRYYDLLSRELSKYYSKNIEEFTEDLSGYIDGLDEQYLYEDKEQKIDKTTLVEAKATEPILRQFFTIMLCYYQQYIVTDETSIILEKSLGTFSNLVGLLGYILYSDDVTNHGNNEEDKHFEISRSCLTYMSSVLEEVKDIFSTSNLPNLPDIVSMIRSNTCIHGIGIKLLEYCVKMSESILNNLERYKQIVERYHHDITKTDENTQSKYKKMVSKLQSMGVNICGKTLDQKNDIIDSLFIMPPFLIATPPDIFNETGFKYMTCIRTDIITNKHPLLDDYFISFFKEDGTHSRLIKIDCKNTYSKAFPIVSSLDFLQNPHHGFSNTPLFVPLNRSQESILIASVIHESHDITKDLMRIPYTFQRQRSLIFNLYAAHTLNIVNLLRKPTIPTANQSRHDIIFKNKDTKIYDLISLEETVAPYQLLSIINLKTKTHMYNNSADFSSSNSENSKIGKVYHIDLLQNIVNLKYSPGVDKKPTVYLPQNQQDITRQYEYSRILGRMFFKDMYFNQILQKPSSYNMMTFVPFLQSYFSSFQDYFKHCFGQESIIGDIIFQGLKIKIGCKVYTKTTMNKMTVEIFDIPNLQVTLCAMLLDAADILTSITFINAPIKLKELMSIYNMIIKMEGEQKIITTALQNLIEDIIVRMRVFMYYVNLFYQFICVYPNEWLFNIFTDNPEAMASIWYHTVPNMKQESINILAEKYHMTIYNMIQILCPFGNSPNTYQYNFTELSNDIYLIKSIRDKFNASFPGNSSSLLDAPTFSTKLQTSLPILNDMFHYYKDNDKMKLSPYDEQESIRVRFEYIMKTDLVDMHMNRMVQFRHLEEIFVILYQHKRAIVTCTSRIPAYQGDMDGICRFIKTQNQTQHGLYKYMYDTYIIRFIIASDAAGPSIHVMTYSLLNELHAMYENMISLEEDIPIMLKEINMIHEEFDRVNLNDSEIIFKKIFGTDADDESIMSKLEESFASLKDEMDKNIRLQIIKNIKEQYISKLNPNNKPYAYIYLYSCCHIQEYEKFEEKTNAIIELMRLVILQNHNNA